MAYYSDFFIRNEIQNNACQIHTKISPKVILIFFSCKSLHLFLKHTRLEPSPIPKPHLASCDMVCCM